MCGAGPLCLILEMGGWSGWRCYWDTLPHVHGPRWGKREAGSHVQEESRQGRRICAITLFGLQGSYLFARVDMFLSTRGAVQVWKSDSAEVYLFILRARQPNRTGLRRGAGKYKVGEYEVADRVFQKVLPLSPVPACCAPRPAELWVVERTRPPSACTTWTTTRCWQPNSEIRRCTS